MPVAEGGFNSLDIFGTLCFGCNRSMTTTLEVYTHFRERMEGRCDLARSAMVPNCSQVGEN